MISQKLKEARTYEETMETVKGRAERPSFHLSPRVGWMNDPNGFSFYQGKYHLFYQYHPYDTYWGPMHWGHAVSGDLLHWENLPAALAPDMPYDKDGCFSGSAVELEDGRHLLMYTGVVKEPQPDGSMREVQTQCMAIGDGRDYKKCRENPVLTRRDLPEGGSPFDFRDPKIWREKDGSFHCVVGNCTHEKDGKILEYKSQDGIRWAFDRILAENHKRLGQMWECPDFFELDGKYVLLTSPQDMLPQGLEYRNGNGTVCFIGHEDSETGKWVEENNQAIDYGIDFYAPQTMLTPDGRRVMIGWMQNWDTSRMRWTQKPWYGQMTLPREIFIKNQRLYQLPVKELETLRKEKRQYCQVPLKGRIQLEGIRGREADLEIRICPADREHIYRKFTVQFALNDKYHTDVSFWPYESVVKFDRSFSGSPMDMVHQRLCQVNSRTGELKMRIILDKFSAEVFINDGEHVMTATFYTDEEAEEITFFADGDVIMDVIKYSLEP